MCLFIQDKSFGEAFGKATCMGEASGRDRTEQALSSSLTTSTNKSLFSPRERSRSLCAESANTRLGWPSGPFHAMDRLDR